MPLSWRCCTVQSMAASIWDASTAPIASATRTLTTRACGAMPVNPEAALVAGDDAGHVRAVSVRVAVRVRRCASSNDRSGPLTTLPAVSPATGAVPESISATSTGVPAGNAFLGDRVGPRCGLETLVVARRVPSRWSRRSPGRWSSRSTDPTRANSSYWSAPDTRPGSVMVAPITSPVALPATHRHQCRRQSPRQRMYADAVERVITPASENFPPGGVCPDAAPSGYRPYRASTLTFRSKKSTFPEREVERHRSPDQECVTVARDFPRGKTARTRLRCHVRGGRRARAPAMRPPWVRSACSLVLYPQVWSRHEWPVQRLPVQLSATQPPSVQRLPDHVWPVQRFARPCMAGPVGARPGVAEIDHRAEVRVRSERLRCRAARRSTTRRPASQPEHTGIQAPRLHPTCVEMQGYVVSTFDARDPCEFTGLQGRNVDRACRTSRCCPAGSSAPAFPTGG